VDDAMRIILMALSLALSFPAMTFADEDDPLPPHVAFSEAKDPGDRTRIIANLNDNLNGLGVSAKIEKCTAIYNYVEDMPSGRDSSFGAICTLTTGRQLLMCDDWFVGKFTMTGSFALTRDNIRYFIQYNCPPGG
jgi:hypothetical protein